MTQTSSLPADSSRPDAKNSEVVIFLQTAEKYAGDLSMNWMRHWIRAFGS